MITGSRQRRAGPIDQHSNQTHWHRKSPVSRTRLAGILCVFVERVQQSNYEIKAVNCLRVKYLLGSGNMGGQKDTQVTNYCILDIP